MKRRLLSPTRLSFPFAAAVAALLAGLSVPKVTAATLYWDANDGEAGFGDATVWNVGTNFAWLPVRNFEIGVEVIYARVTQDVVPTAAAAGVSKSDGNVTGRLRIERTF